MKAAYYEGNQRFRIGECKVIPPKQNEVQIKVSYAGICGTDLHIYHGLMDGRVSFPHVMGHEMSGIVQEVGEGTHGFNPGDRVTVMPLNPCGGCPACEAGHRHICHRLKFMGIETPGAFQTLWTVPSYTLHRLPDTVSMENGAMIEPLAVACHDVRMGRVRQGEYVVVLGGGPIGALIGLAAKQIGAKVLISEINPYRLQVLSQCGLDTFNPNEGSLVDYVNEQTDGAGADVVFEVTASTAGAEIMTQLPRTRGRIVVVGIFSKPVPVDLHNFFRRELQLIGTRVYEEEDFIAAIHLAGRSQLSLDRMTTKIYSLEQLETGFKEMESRGNATKILLSCS